MSVRCPQIWLALPVYPPCFPIYLPFDSVFFFFGCRDRLRTTTNVLGDSIGAGIVEFLSRHELRSKDVEMGNSVLEEKERKKPYKLISQDSDFENDKRAHSESNM